MTKILIDRAVVEQALEALELYVPKEDYENRPVGNVIDALRAALAEPVLNPAPGYCKHCKQYTIEEPLPAEPVQEPPKWKLVPTEPTIGMCIAGDEARQNVDDLTRTPAIYRAMIAAAPAAPQQPEPMQVPTSAAIHAAWSAGYVEGEKAALAEPTVDDPHRDHWVAIAEAAQKIAASTECGLAEAKALCNALDRLTEAALAEPGQEPVAWGLFAKIGGEFVLQHPVRFSEADAKKDRLMFAPDTVIEIRPLYTSPPQRPAQPVQEAEMRRCPRCWEPMFPPQPTPLTVERLRDALVASRIVPPAAVEDPDGYDDGVTLHRIEALHRRLA